ncbi:hypothetical protein [Streptomyces sp. NPDC055607]
MIEEEAPDAGAHWLSLARPSMTWTVWSDWKHNPWAYLPTGIAWDVVAVPAHRLTIAAEHRPETWTDVPVLADLGTRYTYVWVPAGTDRTWKVPGTTVLGQPWWIAVPRPGGSQVPERRWVQPPGAAPRLMEPAALYDALSNAPATGRGAEQ